MKRKKSGRRIIAVLLALALVIGSGIPAGTGNRSFAGEKERSGVKFTDAENPSYESQSQNSDNDSSASEKPSDRKKTSDSCITAARWEFATADRGNSIRITRYNGAQKKVTVPKKLGGLPVTDIGDRAFADSEIISIRLPETVRSVGREAFADAADLRAIDLANVSEVGKDAFRGTAFENKYVELWKSGEFSGVIYTGNVAYKYMSSDNSSKLMSKGTKLVLENSTTGVSESLFNNSYVDTDSCKANLRSVYIPAGTTFIPAGIFRGFKGSGSGLEIYGIKDSYASDYAAEQDISFTALNKKDSYTQGDMDHYWYDDPVDDGVYEINTADELRAFQDIIRLEGEDFYQETVRLGSDIDLGGLTEEGYGIAGFRWKNMHGFRGTFDGSGHKITGVYMDTGADNTGFFGSAGSNCTIKDLTIEGSISGGDRTGGIVGSTSKRTVIENCTFRGTVSGGSKEGSVGGIIGYARQTEVTGCSSYGKVVSHITTTGTDEQPLGCTGGIAGYDYSTSITDCTNHADISGNDDAVGGIAGQSIMAPVTNCVNKGSVTGYQRVGGISGNNMKSVISGCTNSGKISSIRSAGGIIGYGIGTVSGGRSVLDCSNSGPVTADTSAGGIIGYDHDSPVAGCVNSGSVESVRYAGGISGHSTRVEASECTNKGSVTADHYAAGILAFDRGSKSTLTDCSSSGKVRAADNSTASKLVN
ncbi:MAG: leucine-rich repeat domain-containing protein [Clostridiales bacterium]|nr:leucine-rich repeat domain-containing protein [Clostridiales bacterium]